MLSIRKFLALLTTFALAIGASGCDLLDSGENQETGIIASGVVETIEVTVAAELPGRVAEVFVKEGEQVRIGDPLFRLDDELLEGQRKQALAALDSAESNLNAAVAGGKLALAQLEAAKSGLEAAKLGYQLELLALRQEEQPNRAGAWSQTLPNEFETPPWYFTKDQEIAAAEVEVEAAGEALRSEQANYDKVMESASNADLKAAEKRLANAQATFLVIEELRERALANQDKKEIDDYLETLYDNATAELESAQKDLDALLSSQAAEEVLEAKARLTVAMERYETALDRLTSLLTGHRSLRAQVAQANLNQVQASVSQAEAMVSQAQSAVEQAEKAVIFTQTELDLVDMQINKLTIRSAVSGVVMVRNVEPGEIIQPGISALTIGQLDQLTITVYVSEDRYGAIKLGDHAKVTADSFPELSFSATVMRIADQAEYTPRNVQTQEDRRTIVFAIELLVDDDSGKLKPGMPVDVTFQP